MNSSLHPAINSPLVSASLLCHPLTPASAVQSIEASANLLDAGGLAFRYCLRGDMARLRVPPKTQTNEANESDALWQHTCCEAFVALAGESAYREFNFSPSGCWATYAFSAYRCRADLNTDQTAAPQIESLLTPGRLVLEARVGLAALPENPARKAWQVGLTMVVETEHALDGERSYWALQHAAERPDFHLRASFILTIPFSL